MKRILGLFLLVLLLCGCTGRDGQEVTTQPPAATEKSTLPTEPRGLYVPESELEKLTSGAVRVYQPEMPDTRGILNMNGDLLVYSGESTTTLTRYAGENLFPVAGCELDCLLDPGDSSFQISPNGITYFNAQTREVVFLDNDLKEVSRLAMPEDLMGKIVLSSNRTKIFYCTNRAVRVYEMETGLDKLLKTIAYPYQTVESVLDGDRVLRCTLMDEQGRENAIFISTQTGELIAQLRSNPILETHQDRYFAQVAEGIGEQLLFSLEPGVQQVLTPRVAAEYASYLPAISAAVTAGREKENLWVEFYDLASGHCQATLALPGEFTVTQVVPGPEEDILFLMGSREGSPVILRWQLSASSVEDATVYTGPRYTRENPDTEGLGKCAQYAAAIGEAHGVTIRIGEDAVAAQPWDYTLTSEYQTAVIQQQLEILEALLSRFPKGFFDQIPGTETICLVRSIVGNAESGSVEAASGLQFWYGEEAYIALAPGTAMDYAFFHEVFHIMDGKILSDTRAYYYWHNLNPKGFAYYEDYTSYLTEDSSQYLGEEDRAFIDSYSMSYPKEDRARIMEYACNPGNRGYFQSEMMQSKLRTLCQGIREAFHLEDYREPLIWEQYLKLE